jgi:hypothetical protein
MKRPDIEQAKHAYQGDHSVMEIIAYVEHLERTLATIRALVADQDGTPQNISDV